MLHALKFNNPFRAEHYRRGKLIGIYSGHNGVTIEGKNHMLNEVFPHSAYTPAPVDPWYIGVINNVPTPVLSENDTLASNSWTEFTNHDSGNRQAWSPAAASNKVKGSASVVTLTSDGDGEWYGLLVASVQTGTSGLLWATGAFDNIITVVATDQIRVTYGVRM